MAEPWRLNRTVQCAKCPWRVGVNPHEIPDGYDAAKHRDLADTIAQPGDLSGLASGILRVMACHETDDAHCVGWLHHQLGEGNNIALRLQMFSCTNANRLRVIGAQHERFEDTLPNG